jgi:hypothetical protein
MREDMQKLIVERPRLGSARTNYKSGKRLGPSEIRVALAENEDYDSGPRRASSSRRNKWLNENLAPLRRYLHSQIGRPWNKVFSEIRQNLDTRSAIGLHAMQHLYQFIYDPSHRRRRVRRNHTASTVGMAAGTAIMERTI